MSKKTPTVLQHRIICYAYAKGKKGITVKEVANALNCSTERVRETRIQFEFTKGKRNRNLPNDKGQIYFANGDEFKKYL